jgi:hypothetical protein
LKVRQPPYDPDDNFRLALTEWEVLEWGLLRMSDKDFSAWLSQQPPEVIGATPVLTGDSFVDSWIMEVAESLKNGGDGIPASWKTEEATWLDQKIKSLIPSKLTEPRPLRPPKK